MKRLGMNNAISAHLRGICYSFALLPFNKMEEGLEVIENHFHNFANDNSNTANFLRYMRTYWLKPVTSVFGSTWRTNNFVKSGNRYIKARFGKRPSFWVFIGMFRFNI